MSFNELNSVENYIIKELTGVNLNTNIVSEDKSLYGDYWQYKSPLELNRSVNEVLLESELKQSLIRLNPEITKKTSTPTKPPLMKLNFAWKNNTSSTAMALRPSISGRYLNKFVI